MRWELLVNASSILAPPIQEEMAMIKKILAILTIVYMAIVSILPFTFGGNVDSGAVRYKSEGDIYYLDSEALALSDSSDISRVFSRTSG